MSQEYQFRLFEVDKPCTKCGVVKPLSEFWAHKGGKQPKCKECDRAENREWFRRNKDKKREYDKQDRERHPERHRAYRAHYYQENAEALDKQSAAWAAAHPEYERQRQREYRKTNPEKCSANRQNRRALLKGAPGTITPALVRRMYKDQGGRCLYCDVILADVYHADHKTPLSRGGTNEPENLALACAECNLRKYTKTAGEYMEYLRM